MQSDQSTIQAKNPSKLTIILQRALMKTHIALYRLSHGTIGGLQGKVENGRQTILVTARTLEGEERAHMWRAITDNFANFATYQQYTTREIPLVILSPIHTR